MSPKARLLREVERVTRDVDADEREEVVQQLARQALNRVMTSLIAERTLPTREDAEVEGLMRQHNMAPPESFPYGYRRRRDNRHESVPHVGGVIA